MWWLFLLLCFPCFASTLYGIDQLESVQLHDKKIALLAHKASVNSKGEHLIDLTYPKFSVKKIFAPEHGLRSQADGDIQDEVDSRTGLPIISLYKKNTRAPEPKDLADIDTIIIDLQDVGVRYYTYSSTVAEMLKVAKQMNKEVIILDRPNPNGREIEGNILDKKLTGHFISYHNIPLKHGMTLAELALMYNQELKIFANLKVVPLKHWDQIGHDANRAWVPSSPAITTAKQAQLYALWGALESANLSVGRGKDNQQAFTKIGAPWISKNEAIVLAEKLNQLNFYGVNFNPTSWKVDRDIHEGKRVDGVQLEINDFYMVDAEEFLYKVTATLMSLFGERLTFNAWHLRYYGSAEYFAAIKNQTPWEQIQTISQMERQLFYQRRAVFLLYSF
jgi:uncharacterized protein YbbC (DUF1343 family)